MVLGARDETPDEIEEQFQQTGTLHLFAVSGLNVAIVAHLLWIIGPRLRIPRRWAIGIIIPALFFYAAVTGLNPSSVRAALMAAVVLGGYFVDRRVLAANRVAAAAVMVLCFDTNQLFSTGFQLSFAVVIAIVLAAEPFLKLWCAGSNRILSFRASLLAGRTVVGTRWADGPWPSVSLAAWVGSPFLILPYFHLVTPVSLLANLVVVPLAFFVLAVGLMSLLVTPVAPCWPSSSTTRTGVSPPPSSQRWSLFARAPAGHFYIERPSWPTGGRVELTALDLDRRRGSFPQSPARLAVDCGPERDFKRIVRDIFARAAQSSTAWSYARRFAAHRRGLGPSSRGLSPSAMDRYAARPIVRAFNTGVDRASFKNSDIAPQFCGAGADFDIARDIHDACPVPAGPQSEREPQMIRPWSAQIVVQRSMAGAR